MREEQGQRAEGRNNKVSQKKSNRENMAEENENGQMRIGNILKRKRVAKMKRQEKEKMEIEKTKDREKEQKKDNKYNKSRKGEE